MDDLTFSRPRATALSLGDLAPDRHQFVDKLVLLTGEPAVLATQNGRQCLLLSLRLLGRMCRNLSVAIPEGHADLIDEVRSAASEIRPYTTVTIKHEPRDADADAVLCVGSSAHADPRWTVVNSNGWLARVSSGQTGLVDDCNQWNPIGALAAASLGAAEIFKRLIRLKESRGHLLEQTTFSLYSYTCGGEDPGPSIAMAEPPRVLLVGAGAIGNGILYLLRALRWQGHVDVVDYQVYGAENWGTCLMLPTSKVCTPKAEFAESFLKAAVASVTGHSMTVEEFADSICPKRGYPDVILAGVDSVGARHAVQDLWPGIVIDGAIGAFGCQVSCHPWGPDVACLRCLFREGPASAARLSSEASGLSVVRVQQPSEVVTEADVVAAPAEHKEWLRERVGKPICSVIQEAMVRAASAGGVAEGFEPSVPFVACMSASMVLAEAVKTAMGSRTFPEPVFQFDVLRGPGFGQSVPQQRRPDCVCVTRQANIDRWRGRRQRL